MPSIGGRNGGSPLIPDSALLTSVGWLLTKAKKGAIKSLHLKDFELVYDCLHFFRTKGSKGQPVMIQAEYIKTKWAGCGNDPKGKIVWLQTMEIMRPHSMAYNVALGKARKYRLFSLWEEKVFDSQPSSIGSGHFGFVPHLKEMLRNSTDPMVAHLAHELPRGVKERLKEGSTARSTKQDISPVPLEPRAFVKRPYTPPSTPNNFGFWSDKKRNDRMAERFEREWMPLSDFHNESGTLEETQAIDRAMEEDALKYRCILSQAEFLQANLDPAGYGFWGPAIVGKKLEDRPELGREFDRPWNPLLPGLKSLHKRSKKRPRRDAKTRRIIEEVLTEHPILKQNRDGRSHPIQVPIEVSTT